MQSVFISTCCSVLINLSGFLLISTASILTDNFPCGALSNASLKSIKTRPIAFSLSRKSVTLSDKVFRLAWYVIPSVKKICMLFCFPFISSFANYLIILIKAFMYCFFPNCIWSLVHCWDQTIRFWLLRTLFIPLCPHSQVQVLCVLFSKHTALSPIKQMY